MKKRLSTPFKAGVIAALAIIAVLVLSGRCQKLFAFVGNLPGYAFVDDRVGIANHNVPVFRRTDVGIELIKIDGHAVRREMVLTDRGPGVIVPSGNHILTVEVLHEPHRDGDVPSTLTFTADLESRKRYFVGQDAGRPFLVEERKSPGVTLNDFSLPPTRVARTSIQDPKGR